MKCKYVDAIKQYEEAGDPVMTGTFDEEHNCVGFQCRMYNGMNGTCGVNNIVNILGILADFEKE